VLLAVCVLGSLVSGAPEASAAAEGSIPFEIVEYYDPGGLEWHPELGAGWYSCSYYVLAIFDADQAFLMDTAEGPKPHINVSRPNLPAVTPQRAISEIPATSYYTGTLGAYVPREFARIEIPAGKLAYIWYGARTTFDQITEWDTSGFCPDSLRPFAESGNAPRNARNVLGLFSKESPIDVALSSVDGNVAVGDQVPVTMEIRNVAAEPIESFELANSSGLVFNTDYLRLVSGPDPAPPTTVAPGATMTFSYVVEPLRSGTIEVRGGAFGTISGVELSGDATTRVVVPPDLDVALSTTASSSTKVGDEFEVTATLTNNDDVELTDIRAEPLAQQPGGKLSSVSGPTDSNGNDPRTVPLSIPAGGTATISWTYRAEERGSVELTAQFSGRDPREGSLYFLSEALSVAIEAPGLEITEFRLQPGSIVPGDFGSLRGVVTNIGSVDVADIEFSLDSTPALETVLPPSNRFDPNLIPPFPTLAEGESREFQIPVAMPTDPQGLATYRATITMSGTADVGGVETPVSVDSVTGNSLDLSPYWETIFADVQRNLFQDFLDFIDGTNGWGESSTLGGVAVGSTEGALAALQKLGDGLLTVNDLLGEASGDGGQRLTTDAEAIAAAAREYLHTTSAKKMATDLGNIGVGGVDIFGQWLRKIDRAYVAGDTREVAKLIAEPATALGVAGGVEVVGARLFSKLISQPLVRETIDVLKRAPEPVTDGPDVPYDQIVRRELQDLEDMPTGVRITGETVERAGITPDEHGWMIEQAQELGIAFFVRPRPEQAARFARLGYNAKPMAIKLKSISEIDHKWLGWEDYADSEGLVVFRKPKDPLEAMKAAVERGELEYGGKEIDEIIERYNLRLAEWKSYEQPFGPDGPTVDPREGILMKLNGDSLAPDGSITPGNGFDVQRYGKTINTKVTIDGDGVIRFSHNGKPVFSDIDLLSIAKPDGSPIDPELHRKISEAAGFGIDGQHGDSVMTSDFPNWDVAKKFGVQYANEHKRGGTPLVIVQADVSTLGYVDELIVPEGPIPGSGYDLFAKMTTTYEGAGRR
jgi:hypothetical protein